MYTAASRLCTRCGKNGHNCKTCTGPITSFGLIVFRQDDKDIGKMYTEFRDYKCDKQKHNLCRDKKVYNIYKSKCTKLNDTQTRVMLIERKDTIAFITLIQGVYPDHEPSRSKKILGYVEELTCEERYKLVNFTWNQLWEIAGTTRRNKDHSEQAFKLIDISTIIDQTSCNYIDADYIIPKGRLKCNESIVDCAVREFSEESGYNTFDVHVLLHIPPFEEEFIGVNGNKYKNVYFTAELKSSANIRIPLHEIREQVKEVKNLGWFTMEESMGIIRDCHFLKKKVLWNSYQIITGKKE